MQRDTKVLVLIDDKYGVFGEQRPLQPRVFTQRSNREQGHIIEVDQATTTKLCFVGFHKARKLRIGISPFLTVAI